MYTVKHSAELDLNTVEAGNLVAQILQEDFEFISQDINELRSKSDLKPYEGVDLARNIEVREAMKTLMQYYMVRDKYLEFMEMQRVYGNV